MFAAELMFMNPAQNQFVVKSSETNVKVILDCYANAVRHWVKWSRYNDNQEFTAITINGTLDEAFEDEGYELDTADGEFNLEVPYSSLSFAGKYKCEVTEPNRTAQFVVELVIFGKYSHFAGFASFGQGLFKP